MKKIKLSKKEKEAKVKEFNSKYPVGTPVLYWQYTGINYDGTETREGIRPTQTRSKAFTSAEHIVICVEGLIGHVVMDHIEVIEE